MQGVRKSLPEVITFILTWKGEPDRKYRSAVPAKKQHVPGPRTGLRHSKALKGQHDWPRGS